MIIKPIQAESTEEAVEIIQKRKHVPNPQLNFGEENVEPGDNARYLRYALESLKLPPIDIADPKQVEQRINEYFQYCFENDRKPNVKGLGNWLGVSRETLNNWKRGDYRNNTHCDLIKKVWDIFEELWLDYMQNGKVNPASGIFLGKNLFGYKDVQDVVITPNNPLGQNADPATIQKQIAALPAADSE
jgi:hypothetical protein